MDSIEQQAQTTYMKNLAFFQQEHPDVYEKVVAFDQAVARGHYTPRYELEYTDEGYFDVVEPATGRWLYGMDSRKHAEIIAESIDYSKQDNLFETFHDLRFTREQIDYYDSLPLTRSSLSTIAPVVHYAQDLIDKEKTTMKKLYKFIFLGTGLGLHIAKVHEKIRANVYFVIEDDLELFRLSLFTMDYAALGKEAKLYLSVFDDEESFRIKTKRFLREMFIYNHYIKYFALLSHPTEKLKIIQSVIVSEDHMIFPHSSTMEVFLRPYDYLREGYRFVNLYRFAECEVIRRMPLLVLGAGPSLQKEIAWVKQYQDRFIIVAVTAAMGLLEKEGVKPDILIHVDGFEASMKHLEKVESLDFFDETIALFFSFTYPEFAKRFKKEQVFIIQGGTEVIGGFGQLTASNVGITAYALALLLKAPAMYVLGLDLALDPESGATHVEGHLHAKSLDIHKELALEDRMDYHHTVLKHPGNLREEVPTTPHFISALMELKGIVLGLYDGEKPVYNLSDGAAIHRAEPLRPEAFDPEAFPPQDKRTVRQELRACLMENSTQELTPEQLERIRKRIAHARKVLRLIRAFKKRKFSSVDAYHYDLLGLFIDILAEEVTDEVKDTDSLISVYMRLISGYVFDLINTAELQEPTKHLKKINKILMTQFDRLVSHYVERLEEFLEAYEKREKEGGS